MENKEIITKLHGLVAAYNMPDRAKRALTSGKIMVLCGVTASGKNKLADYLISHGSYDNVVSHTTRKPRENRGVPEQNGVEYWFVQPEEMVEMIEQEQFIEVKSIHGDTCYGTTIAAAESVLERGKKAIMVVDVQGALELAEIVPQLQPIFLLPPSYEIWMERLGFRGDISDGEKHRRMRSASMEIQVALDHRQFLIAVNHEVEITAAEIMTGMDSRSSSQESNRKLAMEFLDTLRQM